MIPRLLCLFGMHPWEVHREVVKEPMVRNEDGMLLCKVSISEERFCPVCHLRGGTSKLSRVEVFENEVEEEESWGA